MRVGITGITGFVGKNLSKYFESVDVHYTDINLRGGYEKEKLNEFNAIIHLAGKAHDVKGVAQLDEYVQINTLLTKQVFDDFLMSKASTFIYMSSIKALADHASSVVSEEFVSYPTSSYGISKRKAEEYLLQQHLPDGKRVIILRPCMIHGPGNKGNLNLLYQFVKRGIPYPLARFNNKRSFLSVENLCFVIYNILNREDILSGIYHVSDTEPIGTNELIQLIAEELNQPARLWRLPVSLIRTFAYIGDWLHLPLDTKRLEKLTENYIVDNQKLLTILKKELPFDTKEGLKKTIRSFRNVD